MRGENPELFQLAAGAVGSSPHARGKQTYPRSRSGRSGLIPACAGKTVLFALGGGGGRAHPRMRGENTCGQPSSVSTHGSSPHARGKRHRHGFLFRIGRLIPACAGKTLLHRRRNRARGAHPRMRGENFTHPRISCDARGSSPHARGKLLIRNEDWDVCRLIPACAGKTG